VSAFSLGSPCVAALEQTHRQYNVMRALASLRVMELLKVMLLRALASLLMVNSGEAVGQVFVSSLFDAAMWPCGDRMC
jgi:hypothetical protein